MVFVEKWMLSPNIINGLLHSLFSDASSEVIVHTQKEENVLLYISLICVVVALFITRKSVSLLFFFEIFKNYKKSLFSDYLPFLQQKV